MRPNISVAVLILVLTVCAWPQSGGSFNIEKSVIAGGGGQASGGTFVLTSTIGQSLAGTTSGGGTFTVQSGFWTSAPLSISGTITYGNAASPPRFISNVALNGTGSPNVLATSTFPGGTYFLSGFGGGAYTVTPSKVGGVNSITSFDAAIVSQHVAGPPNPQLNPTQRIVADVSGNGVLTSFDAGMIAKFVAGPPYAAPGIGSTSTWIFSPVNRSYASISSNLTGEDYSGLLMGEVSGNWNNTGARPEDDRITADTDSPERAPLVVKLPNITTSTDNEIVVPINVEGAAKKKIISYEFDLRYDPSVIQPLEKPVEGDGTASHALTAVTNGTVPGLLRVVMYGPLPLDGNNVLLNLRFKVIGSAESISPIALDRIMFNEGEQRVVTTAGKVELSPEP